MNMKKTIGMLLAAGIVGLSTAVLSAVSVGGRVPAPRTAGSVNAGLDLMPDIVSGLNLLAGEKYETIPSANGIGVWNGEEVVPMDTEDYIIHVTAAEMPATYEKEALKAQAICARTYAYGHSNRYAYPEVKGNMDDTVSFQVYNQGMESAETNEAILATTGQILMKDDAVVDTLYYSTSCGYMQDGTLFGDMDTSVFQAGYLGKAQNMGWQVEC